MAPSDRDSSSWQWNGHEWAKGAHSTARNGHNGNGKPEILDDPRLEAATDWLRQLDWFTPDARLFLFTGLLGGFTTFSAFGVETVHLLRRAEYVTAAAYV